jgi:hypothetical protein
MKLGDICSAVASIVLITTISGCGKAAPAVKAGAKAAGVGAISGAAHEAGKDIYKGGKEEITGNKPTEPKNN